MRLTLTIAALLLSSPALAAATDWQELAPDTRIRLLATERLAGDGTTHLALELDMPAGTKTYWRVPGETGIPLQLDFAGSKGIGDERVLWPFPRTELKDGYTDFVHYGPTVIPIEVRASADQARVEAAVLLGICSDICVPAMASFSLPLDFGKPDPGQSIRIDQALALTPLEWEGPEAPVGAVTFDAASDTLAVTVDPGRLEAASLIVDASEAGYVFGAPQKSPEPNVLHHQVLGGEDTGALRGGAVRIVFMTSDGPFEVTRRVEPSPGQ